MPFTKAIDKSLKICSMSIYPEWTNLTLRASYESAQLHTYIKLYISLVIVDLSIV